LRDHQWHSVHTKFDKNLSMSVLKAALCNTFTQQTQQGHINLTYLKYHAAITTLPFYVLNFRDKNKTTFQIL